jgi:dihydroxyacid dehydratase/phosphogluconate dehydratase
VLTTGCDKTTPAQIMAAATVDLPAIVLSGGPMLNGWHNGKRTGSGTIVWEAREMLARGDIDKRGAVELIAVKLGNVFTIMRARAREGATHRSSRLTGWWSP